MGVGQVIRGIDQGVAGMRVGGLRRIVVPPELGFGAQGTNLVPGNATLLFEVELVAGAEVPFEVVDLREGDGEEATNGRSLSMAYQGWVYDLVAEDNKGESFDSTTADAPFTFTLGVGNVIAGWDLGIAGSDLEIGAMRVGGVRRIVIPHDLAYGAAGRPPQIPAYANAALRGRTARGELIPKENLASGAPEAGVRFLPPFLTPCRNSPSPRPSSTASGGRWESAPVGHRPVQPALPVLHAGRGVRLAPAEGPSEL